MPPTFHRLDERVSIAGQLSPADMPAVAAAGFRMLANNRPDGEALFGQPKSADLAKAAAAAGLAYHDLSFAGAKASPAQVKALAALLAAEAPVLAFWKSGMRSSLLWAAAAVSRGEPLDRALAVTAGAGFDLTPHAATIAGLAGG